jgi:hypothetical protein
MPRTGRPTSRLRAAAFFAESLAGQLSADGAEAGGQRSGWQGNKFYSVAFPCHPFLSQNSPTAGKSVMTAARLARKKLKRHSAPRGMAGLPARADTSTPARGKGHEITPPFRGSGECA